MTLDGIAKFLGLEQDSVKSILGSQTDMFKSEQARLGAEKQAQQQMGGSILSTAASVLALCFPAGQLVIMEDGTSKPIECVQVGEQVAEGGEVLEIRHYVSNEALYRVGDTVATGEHAVWALDSGWTSFAAIGKLIEPAGTTRNVFTLVTATGVMVVGDQLCGDDEHDANDLVAKECA
jgi:hypothetical protein